MRIGIDLGGTKVEVIALEDRGTEAGATLMRHRVPTPAGDYARTLNAIAGLVELAEAETRQTGTVGIATPGAISPATGLLKNSNSTVLNGKPLDRDLEARLGRPVRLQNDANCMALSEAVDGAAPNARVVFGVIIGTGVGGGIAVDRHVHVGRNRIAGEWGHNPLPWPSPDELPGPECYCGKRGCIETFLSGPGLARDYQARGGQQKTAAVIAEAATAGDPLARQCLEIYMDRLARALASIVNVLDPDAIVLAGGLSNLNCLYSSLPELLKSYTFRQTSAPRSCRLCTAIPAACAEQRGSGPPELKRCVKKQRSSEAVPKAYTACALCGFLRPLCLLRLKLPGQR